MGESGLSAAASGAVGMAKAGVNAAVVNPIRRAAADLGGRFTSGARAGFEASGGATTGGATDGAAAGASESASGPPAWARRMQRGQALDKGVSTATHAIKSGDGGGAGSSVDLSESRE